MLREAFDEGGLLAATDDVAGGRRRVDDRGQRAACEGCRGAAERGERQPFGLPSALNVSVLMTCIR